MLKNEMEAYVRIGGRGLKNRMYPYMGVRGVKNCQNHPYVINEWPPNTIHFQSYISMLLRDLSIMPTQIF